MKTRSENTEYEEKFYLHRVQYYETDQMAIVHHSNYIRWFEEARVDFMSGIGYGLDIMEKEGIVSPVIGVACNYKSMTRFGETVRIVTDIREFNGIKLVVGYRIYDADSGELRAEGVSRHCFLNKEGKPISLKKKKPEIYSKMAAYLIG